MNKEISHKIIAGISTYKSVSQLYDAICLIKFQDILPIEKGLKRFHEDDVKKIIDLIDFENGW